MNNITTHLALWKHLYGTQRFQDIISFIDQIILASREVWLNEENLPENLWRTYNKILVGNEKRDLCPIFKGLDPVTYTAGMKQIFSSSPLASDMEH